MRRGLEFFLALICCCSSVAAQTPGACRTAVQHLTLPSSVESPALHPAQPHTPIKFLFSIGGRDVYLATALRPPYPLNPLTDQPLTLVIVYQDEKARQEAITFVRKMGSGGLLLRFSSPSLDNLKFAAIHCKNTWNEFLSTGICRVHDWQYYEPQACIVMPSADGPADPSGPAKPNPPNRFDVMNNLNWLNGFIMPSPWGRISNLGFPLAKVRESATLAR